MAHPYSSGDINGDINAKPNALSQRVTAEPSPRWVYGIALLGMIIGLSLAFTSVTEVPKTTLPANAVAKINDRSISWRDYQQALLQLDSERRSPLTPAQRQRVLDKLINEELLVQYAIALGLVEQDRSLRSRLVGQVMAMQRQMAETTEPSASELQALYQSESEFFTQPGRYRVAIHYCGSNATAGVGETGYPAAPVALSDCNDAGGPYLPDSVLPEIKLRDYLGPSLAGAITALPPEKQSTEPLRYGQGWVIASIVERIPARLPQLEEIRSVVEAEWQRRQGEALLQALIKQLRAEADLQIAEGSAGRSADSAIHGRK